MNHILDRAGEALRRSVRRVRRGPRVLGRPAADGPHDLQAARTRRGDTAMDQSIAALQAVVWIASFVQGVFNEIRGRSDEW